MICVEFHSDAEGRICGFKVEGHAGYADSGYDIICSAVSVLVINTINSIEKFTNDKFDYFQQDDLHHFRMITLSDSSELLLQSMCLGIHAVSDTYGSRYLKIVN